MQWSIPINENGAVDLVGKAEGVEIEIIAVMRRVGDAIHLHGVHFAKSEGAWLGHINCERMGATFYGNTAQAPANLSFIPPFERRGPSPARHPRR